MESLSSYFADTDLREFSGEEYVSAARVNDFYRFRLNGTTQARLVRNFEFDYVIVYRRGSRRDTVADVDINSEDFKPTVMAVYVKSSQVREQPILMQLLESHAKDQPPKSDAISPAESKPPSDGCLSEDNQIEENDEPQVEIYLAGYFFSDLGQLSNLYDSLGISRLEHPPEKYGTFRVGKYSRSMNIEKLFQQQEDGKFVSQMMVMDPPQLQEVKRMFKMLLRSNNIRRVRCGERTYEIVILYRWAQEQKLQTIFECVLRAYASRENILAKIINELISGNIYHDADTPDIKKATPEVVSPSTGVAAMRL